MRNKLFATTGIVIFLAFFVGAPLFLFLTRAGVLPYENVGNQVTAEREYEEDHPLYSVLTAIEDAKVAVRNIRRDAMDKFKAMKKKSEITEDDLKDMEKEFQKVTDEYIKKVDELCTKKEKELSEI